MTTFNHLFALPIAISGSTCPDGSDVTAAAIREAAARILALPDAELVGVLDAPADTYEEEG